MESESRQAHWEKVYTNKSENEVSWFRKIRLRRLN